MTTQRSLADQLQALRDQLKKVEREERGLIGQLRPPQVADVSFRINVHSTIRYVRAS